MKEPTESPTLAEAACPMLVVDRSAVIRWLNRATREVAWIDARLRSGHRLDPAHGEIDAALAAVCGEARSRWAGVAWRAFGRSGGNQIMLTAIVCGAQLSVLVILTPTETRDGGLGRSMLTNKEKNLLDRLAQGQTVREASTAMGISYHTGRKYTQDILRKTEARTQAQAVANYLSGGKPAGERSSVPQQRQQANAMMANARPRYWLGGHPAAGGSD